MTDIPDMPATCGHDDPMGYFAGTPCRRCVDRAYRAVINGTRYRKDDRR